MSEKVFDKYEPRLWSVGILQEGATLAAPPPVETRQCRIGPASARLVDHHKVEIFIPGERTYVGGNLLRELIDRLDALAKHIEADKASGVCTFCEECRE